MIKMKKGGKKRILVGIGVSTNKNDMIAAQEAAKKALEKCGNQKPTLSIVYCDSRLDADKVAKGINSVLGNSKWVGCSADTLLSSEGNFQSTGVEVVCISSQYLHVGISTALKYRNNPQKSGASAIKEAMQKIEVDKYVDPYIQFRRAQTKDYKDIVRTPPYFILTYASGAEYANKKAVPGRETEFLEGIFSVTGPNIPVVGASASVNFDNYMKGKGNNFIFANGKVLRNAAVIVFVISNLYFSYSLQHGYRKSNAIGLITKMDKTGHIIHEINGKPAVEEYARMLKVSKEELMKNPFKYTLPRPLGVLNTYGDIFIKEAVPNPDGKTMYCLTKIAEDSAVTLVTYNEKETIDALKVAIMDANKDHKGKEIGLGLVFSCSGRKALLGKKVNQEILVAKNAFKGAPIIGFHTFTEIGAKRDKPSQVNNQTVSTVIIYDQLLTE